MNLYQYPVILGETAITRDFGQRKAHPLKSLPDAQWDKEVCDWSSIWMEF